MSLESWEKLEMTSPLMLTSGRIIIVLSIWFLKIILWQYDSSETKKTRLWIGCKFSPYQVAPSHKLKFCVQSWSIGVGRERWKKTEGKSKHSMSTRYCGFLIFVRLTVGCFLLMDFLLIKAFSSPQNYFRWQWFRNKSTTKVQLQFNRTEINHTWKIAMTIQTNKSMLPTQAVKWLCTMVSGWKFDQNFITFDLNFNDIFGN